MNSGDIKTAVLCWFRFARRYPYVCTEAGRWNADVIGATETQMTEVEVKISKSDFRADFTKPKHTYYSSVTPLYRGAAWIPNRFYFAVPKEMKDFALEQLATKNSKYGLITFDNESFAHHGLECVKVAQKLHTAAPSDKILNNLLLRMGSELANFHMYSHRYNTWLHEMKDTAKALSGAVDIDPEEPAILSESTDGQVQ